MHIDCKTSTSIHAECREDVREGRNLVIESVQYVHGAGIQVAV